MNYRSLRIIAALVSLFLAPAARPQTGAPESKPKLSFLPLEPIPADSASTSPAPPAKPTPIRAGHKSVSFLHEKKFLLLSAAVYGSALADMHQTLDVRENYWWHETDPLAKPLVRLPAPAYYATGLAMATGVNWLSWKMARSHRWRKLAPIPQILSITGNLYGFHSNRF
jgi:hypothetical protein